MAKKALRNKQQRAQRFSVRNYSRCSRCGRPRAVFRKFGLCRICLRDLAHQGVIPGITPSCASSRRQIRQRPNLRKTARGRPQRLQRL